MATTIELSYFNTFWLKRLKNYVQNGEGSTVAGTNGLTTGTAAANPGARSSTSGYITPNKNEDWYP